MKPGQKTSKTTTNKTKQYNTKTWKRHKDKSETWLTASVIKQDPNTHTIKKNGNFSATIRYKTCANLRGKSILQSDKTTVIPRHPRHSTTVTLFSCIIVSQSFGTSEKWLTPKFCIRQYRVVKINVLFNRVGVAKQPPKTTTTNYETTIKTKQTTTRITAAAAAAAAATNEPKEQQ